MKVLVEYRQLLTLFKELNYSQKEKQVWLDGFIILTLVQQRCLFQY
jgi:hypothetical protein